VPTHNSLAQALRLAALFAAIKFLLLLALNLLQSHLGYGYTRDELYYLVCGQRLAWGYVDHAPLVAVQAKVSPALFGHSLAGVRMLTTLAAAGRVLLTGLVTWALGGRRIAQALAMSAVFLIPIYFPLDTYLSMNSFESIFWLTCLLVILYIERSANTKTGWLSFGVIAGIGLLNKPSMAFFLIALLIALAVTPQRKLLRSRWTLASIAIIAAILLPYLLWQAHNHWPTIEFMRGRHTARTHLHGHIQFIRRQIIDQNPISLILWGAGLLWLLFASAAKTWQWLGLTYLFLLALMLPFSPKHYYVSPIYPMLFAAGAIAWERFFSTHPRLASARIPTYAAFTAAMLYYVALTLPLFIPIFSAEGTIAYQARLARTFHIVDTTEPNGLPELIADRFGWHQEVDEVTRIYHSLSHYDQSKVAILCSNYGEASAINLYGHGLPTAISGDMTYFLWGPRNATGEVMIIVAGGHVEQLQATYATAVLAGIMDDPRSGILEKKNIYLARNHKGNISEEWSRFKHY
jgi:hypothetical protein